MRKILTIMLGAAMIACGWLYNEISNDPNFQKATQNVIAAEEHYQNVIAAMNANKQQNAAVLRHQ